MAITVVLNGGLGNQLFQYATGRALSLKRRTSLVLDPRDYVDVEPGSPRWCWITDLPIAARVRRYPSPWFAKSLPAKLLDRIAHPLRHHQQVEAFDPAVLDQPDGIVIIGLFQSYRHFAHVYEEFAHELDLAAIPAAADNSRIAEFGLADAVGVHVRRGDYLNHNDFVMKDSDRYYSMAMAEIRDRGERAVVFSDDIDWCREQEFFAGAAFYPTSDGPPYIDMHAMSLCRRLVIANSTYSWWAGWFAHRRGVEVVAPRTWIGRSTTELPIVPPAWRLL
jgi:hypothetical protein